MRNKIFNYIPTSFISSSCTWIFTSASSNFNFTFVWRWTRYLPGFCSSQNTGSHWQCSHPTRSGHRISPVAFIKGSGKQLNIYLKCDTRWGKERPVCSSGRQLLLWMSLLSSSKPSALVPEPFRQAGLWDQTAPHSQTSHCTHCRKFHQSQGCYCLLRALLWVSAEERMNLAKQSHIYITANASLFPSTLGER